jgi:hypothetical protein
MKFRTPHILMWIYTVQVSLKPLRSAFAKRLFKVTISFECLSVYPHGTNLFALDGFS